MSSNWGGYPLSGSCRASRKDKKDKKDKRKDKDDESADALIKNKRSSPRAAQAGNHDETL